jgi:iron complex outermembrane recepter protein
MRRGWVVVVALCVSLAPRWAAADETEDGGEAPPVLDDLSLEELLSLDLKVVSASKRAEELSGASAAIYVITGEEIRRIGAMSVPEALRIVPGMHVARADGSSWAVATRSFSGRFNTRMLALVDGRTIYSPLFGGMFWERQDTMLTDVDRIEVIRGPGGTLWGVNAVNGVINITTKSAADTQGLLATGGGGTEERAFGSVRYGGTLGSLAYRVWTHHHERGDMALANGDPANDKWSDTRGGVRMDWKLTSKDLLTVQGDVNKQEAESDYTYDLAAAPFVRTFDGRKDSASQYALARYRHELGEKTGLQVQAFYDHLIQEASAAHEVRDTSDVDVQFDTSLGAHNRLIAGGGFRSTADQWRNRADGEFLALDTLEARDNIVNVYAQNELSLSEDRVRFVVGSKFERNDFTGFEFSPSARVSVSLAEHHDAWASVSRAVKTPSRLFRDGRAPAGFFRIPGTDEAIRIFVVGNPELKSEKLIALEGGYRTQLGPLSLDGAVFYNIWDDIIQPETDNPSGVTTTPEGELVVTVPFGNIDDGVVYGAELSTKYSLNERFAIAGGWSYTHADLGRYSTTEERAAPATMANVRLYMNVTERVEWNVAGYFYDVSGRYDPQLLRGNDLVVQPVRRLDAGVTIRVTKHAELAIWGQNLTEERHQEMKESYVTPSTFVERGAYARLTTRFF